MLKLAQFLVLTGRESKQTAHAQQQHLIVVEGHNMVDLAAKFRDRFNTERRLAK